jgi:diguanylate cyclase (GGDEF)-like protein
VKILIADDDPVTRRLVEAMLNRMGHDVMAVTGGADALSALLAADAPRLAILDWEMPDPDGLAVCRAVRSQAGEYVYLILLTSHDRREDRAAAYDAGVDDFLSKPLDVQELTSRLRSGARVLDLQARLLEAQESLRHQATHDHLTGLWNRRMILDVLARELNRSMREQRSIAVAMVDIDHFKRINDTHGHAAGDLVLQHTATRLKSALRDYDSVGRYGGEEFLLVLPGCDRSTGVDVVERIRTAIAALPVEVGTTSVAVTLSAGVTWSIGTTVEAPVVIQAADEALYRAKAGGRNRVESQPCDV